MAGQPKVFVSYRREGAAGHAGRLYDALEARFGEHNVCMDLRIPPGVDFVDYITAAVGDCRALIVVMGPDWATVRESGGDGPRIAQPGDFVRLEVETALRNPDVMVFPVLVGGARMPDPEELPPELRALSRRNATELTDLRWRYDCTRLVAALDDLVHDPGGVRRRRRTPGGGGASARQLVPLWLEGVAIVTAAGLLVRDYAEPLNVGGKAPWNEQIVSAVTLRGVCWAAIGAVLAIWLTLRRGERRRLLRRTVMGLLVGALAGTVGGAIFGFAAFPVGSSVEEFATGAEQARIQLGALAATGGVLGLGLGLLWIPPRVLAGCLGGALGGMLTQMVMIPVENPPEQYMIGVNCFGIVGLTMLALLVLDVRAAAAEEPPEPVPQPAVA